MTIRCNTVRFKEIKELLSLNWILSENASRFICVTTDFTSKGLHMFIGQSFFSIERALVQIDFNLLMHSFSDAYSLTRKLRDDFITALWIIFCIRENNFYGSKAEHILKILHPELNQTEIDTLLKHTESIIPWLNSTLDQAENKKIRSDFYSTESIIKQLKRSSESFKTLMDSFLNDTWNNLRLFLNNNVHSNGLKYIENNYRTLTPEKDNSKFINNINCLYVCLISMTIIVYPYLVLGTEGVDMLEMGLEPTEESLISVAPGITDFLTKHAHMINNDLYDFLKENSQIELKFQ